MTRPRAADDFATIRARMEELRREREIAMQGDNGSAGSGDGRMGLGVTTDAERRRRRRMEGLPPPWVPTIFVRKPRR